MYYELANIRQYKDSKQRPFFQIRVKKDSKLTDIKEKVKPIALVDVDEIKEIAKSSNIKNFNELQANFNSTSEELVELKQQLQELKATNESLTSEVEKLKAEKVQLQEDLLTEKNNYKDLVERTNSKVDVANANVIEAKEKIITLQEEQKAEVKELNTKLEAADKKIEKLLILINNKDNDIVYLAKRGLGSRIRNKLTERIEATIIEVEAKTSEE